MGQVVIDHRRQFGNIQAASCNICGDHDLDLAFFKLFKGSQSFRLGFVTMDRVGGDTLAQELSGQATGADFRIGKDNHLPQTLRLHQMGHCGTFGLMALNLINNLGDIFCRGIASGNLNHHRAVIQKGLRELANLWRKSGGKEKALPGFGQQINDALQIRQEPHVQHSIGLIKHQYRDRRQGHGFLLHMVQQTARSGDQNFHARAKLSRLWIHINATKDHGTFEWDILGVGAHVLSNLVGEFPCGGQHQGADRVSRR